MSGLLIAGVLLLSCGLAGATYHTTVSKSGLLRAAFDAYCARLDTHTQFLLSRYSGAAIGIAQAASIAVCLGLWAATRSSVSLIVAAAISVGPPAVLMKLHRARVARLEHQLETWLVMLASALRSTPSLGEAIASTAMLIPPPFSEEVDLVVKEVKLGVPLHRALNALSSRAQSILISGAVMTISVARQTGGDLPAMLERKAAALRESVRLEGVLRAKTAEGRGQVLVLALVPFILCLVIGSLDPTWFDPMFASHLGRVIFAACAAAWVLSTTWAYQIVGTEL